MPRIPFASILLAIACSLLPGCSGTGNPHIMPRTRPLFAGLNEQKLGNAAKPKLAEAKADFQLARDGRDPLYAKFSRTIPGTHSRVFEGRGYRLTLVNKDLVSSQYVGPEIVLGTDITGGRPFEYDEVTCISD